MWLISELAGNARRAGFATTVATHPKSGPVVLILIFVVRDPELTWRLLPRSPARSDKAWAKERLTPAVGLARSRSSSGWALPSWVQVGFAGGAGQAQ